MSRCCWVNLLCQVVLLISIRVGQGPTGLAVGAGGCCLDIFSLIYVTADNPTLRIAYRFISVL